MQRESSQDIDEQASRWAARIDRAPLTAAQSAELAQWLAADARRRGALLRARAVLMHSASAAALGPGYDPEAFLRTHGEEEGPANASRRRVLGWGVGIAASAAATAVLPLMLPGGRVYATGRGEMRLVPLADGSTVTLNTATRLRVAFDEVRRLVTLLEGEAWFEAAVDLACPFMVRAGARSLATAGGAFLVRNLSGQPVQVIVRDGSIALAGGTDASGIGHGPALMPNQQASLAAGGAAVLGDPVTHEDIARELAWREGKIAFHGESLADAAAAFSRYSHMRIVIDDPLLAREPITGLFAANDPAGFSRAIAGIFDARVHVGRDTIAIDRAH